MFIATMRAVRRHIWWAGLGAALLSGCGGGGSDDPVAREEAQARPSYSVGGTITFDIFPPPDYPNSTDQISLSIDGVSPGLAVDPKPDGSFTHPTALFNRDRYDIQVTSDVPFYKCSVTAGGSGTIMRSNVSDVAIACNLIPTYGVWVQVSGVPKGKTLVIWNLGNSGNSIRASVDGKYEFPFKQQEGTNYGLSIFSPSGVTCDAVPSTAISGLVTTNMVETPIQVQCS